MIAAVRVLIVGPDGSGKSTLADACAAALESRGLRIARVHFDPKASVDASRNAHTEPHSGIPRRWWGQVLAIVRRAGLYLWARRPGGTLTPGPSFDILLQERGWLDQSVDPMRYRGTALTARLALFFRFVAPRFDLVVVAGGDPAVMHARKPELSEHEVARQVLAWQELFAHETTATFLDSTTASVPELVTRIVADVLRVRRLRVRNALRRVTLIPGRLEMVASANSRVLVNSVYRPTSRIGRIRLRWSLPLRSRAAGLPAYSEMIATALEAAEVRYTNVAAVRSVGRDQFVVAAHLPSGPTHYIKARWGEGTGILKDEFEKSKLARTQNVFDVPASRFVESTDPRMCCLVQEAVPHPPDVFPSLHQVLEVAVALRATNGGHGITHNDFHPWNLLPGDPPTLLDWELSSREFVPGVDLFDYLAGANPEFQHDDLESRLVAYSGILQEYAAKVNLPVQTVLDAIRAYRSEDQLEARADVPSSAGRPDS